MSVRVKDMFTIVEDLMGAIYELGPTCAHIRVVELHFAVLEKVFKNLERDS
jgi:hypothetical protein